MERLINHLQQSLDDDEAAKDALLSLMTGTMENIGQNDSSASQEHESERQMLVEENSNVFVLQSITSRILKDSASPIDLPIKIIAMHLDISPKLIRQLCKAQTIHTTWSSKFTGCFKQVLDVQEWFAQNQCLLISPAQEAKLKSLREEVQRMQEEPYGAVARFILSTIVDFISTRAAPLPLQLPHHLGSSVPGADAMLPPLVTREIDLHELVINPPNLHHLEQQGSQQAEQVEDVDMKVILLAPLVLKPRSSKHFIVPLMEPDLLGDFQVNFPPQRIAALL